MPKKNPYLEDRKLIMHQFSEHTKALGCLTQEVKGLRDDVIAIKTEVKVESKQDNRKYFRITSLISVLLAGLVSLAIALL